MKRTKFKTGILAVVFCSLTFLFSGDGNSIYADEILTDTELPVGRFSFEEKTEEADDEDYESVEEDDVAEQSLLRMTGISADDWEKYGSDYFYEQLSDEEKKYWDDLDAICAKYLTTETDAVTTNTGTYRMKAISGSTLEKEKKGIADVSVFKTTILFFKCDDLYNYILRQKSFYDIWYLSCVWQGCRPDGGN